MNLDIIDDPKIKHQKLCCLNFIEAETKLQEEIKYKSFNFLNSKLETEKVIISKLGLEKYNTEYEDFLIVNFDKILVELLEKIQNKPYKKIIKIRGAYATHEQATKKITELERKMKKKEPVRMYVAEVGKWIPFITNEDNADNLQEKLNYTLYDYTEKLKINSHEFEKRVSKDTHREISNPNFKDYNKDTDYLDEDSINPYQQFFIVSFYEPEKEIEKIYLEMTHFEFIYSYYKNQLDLYNIKEKETNEIIKKEVYEEYMNYTTFELQEQNNLISCFKLKCICNDENEADIENKKFQLINENHDIFVGKVGSWLVFNPLKTKMNIKHKNEELDKICKAHEDEQEHVKQKKKEFQKQGWNIDETKIGDKFNNPEHYF